MVPRFVIFSGPNVRPAFHIARLIQQRDLAGRPGEIIPPPEAIDFLPTLCLGHFVTPVDQIWKTNLQIGFKMGQRKTCQGCDILGCPRRTCRAIAVGYGVIREEKTTVWGSGRARSTSCCGSFKVTGSFPPSA